MVLQCRNKRHKHALSDEELRQATPCELVRNVLPKALAEELLMLLLAESPSWHPGQWVLFGKTHAAPRTSCYYALDAEGEEGSEQEGAVTDEFRDVSARVERRQALGSLRKAADIINATVQVPMRPLIALHILHKAFVGQDVRMVAFVVQDAMLM
jgi:hypothetical protein